MSSNYKDIGIIATKLSNDKQSNELVSFCKEYISNNPYNQICFFNSFCTRMSYDNIPILHLSQAKFFYGNIIVTDIKDLELCLYFPNIYQILFICYNIPWENEIRNYKEWEKLFYNDRVKIIATNQRIHDLFKILYKEPINIIQELNYEKIQKCL